MEEVGEQEAVGDDVDEVDHEQDVSFVIFIWKMEKSWQNPKEKKFIGQRFESDSILDCWIGGCAPKSILFHHVLLECEPWDHHEQGDEGQADPEDGGVNVDLVDNFNSSEVRLYGRVHNSYNKYQGRLEDFQLQT